MMAEIPELKDILRGDLAERADWIVANLDTSISWPVEAQKVAYLGTEFWLVPITRESYPAVATKRHAESREEVRSRLMRFLSAVSWSESAGIMVDSFGGGSLPRPMGRQKSSGLTITQDLNLTYLPEPADDRGRLALALMREARGLNHPAYAFLSFYRVLEAAIPAPHPARDKWIATNLGRLRNPHAQDALKALNAAGVLNVADHIRKARRHAIAHAASGTIINPDDIKESDNIRSELPIMIGLAELAIEEEIGVRTRHTIWKEHLFELEGFKNLLGADRVQRIVDRVTPSDGEVIDLPPIDVELRRREPYAPLQRMQPYHASQVENRLQLVYASPDGLVKIVFELDFEHERLRFDWNGGILGDDDGSANAARHAAELTRFVSDYIGNGELHIFESDTRELLSRVDAFIPVNFWANQDALNSQIQRWKKEASQREVI
jgi:hypothetical protein